MKQSDIIQTITLFVRSNSLFLMMIILFLVVLIFYVPSSIQAILETNDKINVEKREIQNLENQYKTINEYAVFDLDTLATYSAKLVPDNGDSFSIHTSLDTMSTRHGFTVISKNVPADFAVAQTEIPVSLNIEGSADAVSQVLKNHRYIFGRFLTITSITVDILDNKATFGLTFYSANGTIPKDPLSGLKSPDTAYLQTLEREFELSKNTVIPDTVNDEYVPSQLPFGKTSSGNP